MDYNQILKKLSTLNEDEIFYKKYFYTKLNKDNLNCFLKALNKSELYKRKLIVPEIMPEIIPHNMNDATYFELSQNKSVTLMKHNCYTPSFKHSHEFFEIIYVLDGSCTQTISENTIFMLNST